jgi:hypothetical protein
MDTTHISAWLAVIAIASAVQALLLLGATIGMLVMYKRLTAAVTAFERERLNPVMAEVHRVIADAHDVIERVKSIDDDVRHALSRTADKASHAAARVRTGLWPAIGLSRGLLAAWRVFTARRHMLAEDARPSRVAYEGGTHHVRS